MSAIDGELQTVSRFRRPLIPLVLAYGTGVLAGSLVQGNPLFLLAVLFPLLGMVVLAIWTKRQALATALLLVGFLLLGSLRSLQVVHPQRRFHLSTVSDALLTEKVELEGIIVSPPERYPPEGAWRREGSVRFPMQVQRGV